MLAFCLAHRKKGLAWTHGLGGSRAEQILVVAPEIPRLLTGNGGVGGGQSSIGQKTHTQTRYQVCVYINRVNYV